jgi:hypothetical protein
VCFAPEKPRRLNPFFPLRGLKIIAQFKANRRREQFLPVNQCLICSLYLGILFALSLVEWRLAMFLGLLRRRTEWKAAIAADARRLIESFHEHAYFEARERIRGRCIDGGRPARYWGAVKLEIARRQGIAIGLAGADLRG